MSVKVFRKALDVAAPARNAVLPQIHLYEHDNQEGDQLHVYGGGTNSLSRDAGKGWNDDISSAIVISGTWELFEHDDYGGRKLTLTPGVYPSLEAAGMGGVAGATPEPPGPGWNDILSSLKGNW
jgi:hypothetical protein